MVSPQDISALIPEYSVFTTGYLMRDPAHLDAVYDGDIGAEYKARIEKEMEDARVFAGIHFRSTSEHSTELGRKVGAYAVASHLRSSAAPRASR